jgi:thymidylate synthase
MKQYQDLLQDLLYNGEASSDRTGVGTLRKAGHMMRFDLKEGFPLVTTKKVFVRGTIEELLWFLRGSTDVKELQDVGVHFWDSWVDESCSIGHGYGKQFRRIESFVPVTPKTYTPEPIESVSKPLPEPVYPSDTGKTAFKVGEVRQSSDAGAYVILEEIPPNQTMNRTHWRVGFVSTGNTRLAKYGDIQNNSLRDPYRRSVFGVGYYGDYCEQDPYYTVLVETWREMIRRCYHEPSENYASYGGSGVHVDRKWHCFANFQADAKKIPGWSLKLEYPEDYSLDKDVLWASNRYSKQTCCWASYEEQSVNRLNTKYFSAVSPDGVEVGFPSIGEMARSEGMNVSAIHRCLNGKLKSHHGWTDFQYLEVPPGQVLRYRLIDQVKIALAELKHNMDSRRNMIALWNPQDMDRTTLPCCHGSVIQLLVINGTLSMQVYQRSCDSMLGLPVNIASYALLTHMFAQQAGLEVGDLIWVGGDVHLYANHIEQAELVLSRGPKPLPHLVLNKAPSMFDYKPEDFQIVGYEHWGVVKAEVAV